jgi:hypothetical protein
MDNSTAPEPDNLEPDGAHEAPALLPDDLLIQLPDAAPAACIVETRTYTRLSDNATVTWRGVISGEPPADFCPFTIVSVLQLADDAGNVIHAHQFTVPLRAQDLDAAFVEYAEALKAATHAEYTKTMHELNAPRIARPRGRPSVNGK